MTAMALPLCGLWLSPAASGELVLSGRLGGSRVMVAPNEAREGPDSPTHVLVVLPGGALPDGYAGPFRAVGNHIDPRGRRKGAQPGVRPSKLQGEPV
jgi:hypothetical protein